MGNYFLRNIRRFSRQVPYEITPASQLRSFLSATSVRLKTRPPGRRCCAGFQGVSLFDYSVPEGRSRFEPRHNPVTDLERLVPGRRDRRGRRVLAFEGYLFGKFEGYLFGKFEANINNANIDTAQRRDSNTVAIPTYLALFIFGEVYRLVLSWDALQLKNTIQVCDV
ncbi:hypothetical protein V1506DRAFT_527134, partial [Lipomyces tetrasporus]